MFRSTFLLLFFLLFGSASAGVLFVRNTDGTFTEKVDYSHGSSSETVPSDRNLDNYQGNAQSSLDDADFKPIQDFPDQKFNQNGELRYSDLPLVEKSLKKDIFLLIAKNEDYMAFLNHPSHKDLFVMINDMIRGPNQAVLQEQVWKKILAIEAYYEKFVEPLDRPDTIEKAMKLLMRLVAASAHGKLTVEDTVELDQNLETIAFLLNQNLTQRLVSMLENDLHPIPLEHKRNHHVRKSSISETSTELSSSNQTEKFVNVPPSSLGRPENSTDLNDPTIYLGPTRPKPFTNNHGTTVDVSEGKPFEHQVGKNATNDRKLSGERLDSSRKIPFDDEVNEFLNGDSRGDSDKSTEHPVVGYANLDDPTIYIGPRRPMPFTNNHVTKVDVSEGKPSKHQVRKNATNKRKLSDEMFDRPSNFPFEDEVNKFLNSDAQGDSVTSTEHPVVGYANLDDPTIYIGPRRPMPFTDNNGTKADVSNVESSEHHNRKNASNVNNHLVSSDDVLDRPRNFPFSDETKKFVSGDSEIGNVTSTVLPTDDEVTISAARKSAASTVTAQPSTLTRMTDGKHSGQDTTKSDKTDFLETTTMINIP